MKTIKKALIGTALLGTASFFILGSMNSIVVDKQAFLKNDLNIKFAKRIDDITGEVEIGRMAASIPKWNSSNSLGQRVNEVKVEKNEETKAAKFAVKAKEVAKVVIPEPSVNDAPNLSLTGGLFNKKPLKDGKGYSGKAHVVDGVIEEINVTLPGGKRFIINTNERMVGNVFQYEDTETREMKSGLFYEVKKGQYMITLTDDSNYAGLRLEFKAEAGTEVKSDSSQYGSWAMNEQNDEDEEVNSEEEKEETQEEVYAEVDQLEEDNQELEAYSYNDEAEEVEYQDENEEELLEEEQFEDNELVQASSFGFNFNS